MKAKFIMALIAMITVIAVWNLRASKNEVKLSDLALENMEALAQGESSGTAGEIIHNVDVGAGGSPVHKYVCVGSGYLICPPI